MAVSMSIDESAELEKTQLFDSFRVPTGVKILTQPLCDRCPSDRHFTDEGIGVRR